MAQRGRAKHSNWRDVKKYLKERKVTLLSAAWNEVPMGRIRISKR